MEGIMKPRSKTLMGAALAAAFALSTSAGAIAQSDDTGTSITILHGIPGITVDLFVDDELVIAGFDAGDTQDLTPLAGQTLNNIEARQAGGTEVVIGPIATFVVPEEGNASVVVHLDAEGSPTLTPFVNSTPPTEQGRGRLVVRHAAAAPPIEVNIDDEEVLADIGNGQEGSLVLPAGEVSGAWITADGERIAQLPALRLEANTDLIVYVGGSLEADDFEFYLQTIAADEAPRSIEISQPATVVDSDSDADTAQATTADDADAAETDDGTPQPTAVNTGEPIELPTRDMALLYGGMALLVAAAASFVVQQRSKRNDGLALSSTESV